MKLISGDLVLRSVEVEDAEFILSLRLDKEINKYLSHVTNDIEEQVKWIKNYKSREFDKIEFYFIIENIDGIKYGTLRAYDIQDSECMWGSYILTKDRPQNFSYRSANLLFDFLFNTLKVNTIKMEAYKKNTRSIHVCENLGFRIFDSDDEKYYMSLNKSEYIMK